MHIAVNADLEIGNAVAINVAPNDMLGEAKLAGFAGKLLMVDEVESLIPALIDIGVDGLEIDPVMLNVAKIHDHIPRGADRGVSRQCEDEAVGPLAAKEEILSGSAIEQVVAAETFERVVSAQTEDLVAEPAR